MSKAGTNGFTLVELLVVLALAAMLMAVTPPLISAALPGVELKAAARRTAASLRLAREQAIRSGQATVWQLNIASGDYHLEPGDGRSRRLPSGLELSLVTTEREQIDDERGGIRFFADGTSSGGRVVLARGERGFQVGVHWLTGRVLIADWERQ